MVQSTFNSLIGSFRSSPSRALPLFGLALLAFGLAGCGGSQEMSEGIPGWYTNPPEDPNHVFSAQSATSQQMQGAVDKATTGGRAELASNLETQVEAMNKSFTEEVSDEMREQFVQTQRTVTSRVLQGTTAAKKKVMQEENGTYRAFVLMDMPIGKAAKELMSKVKQDDEMYTRFRSSQAFEEMEEAIQEYEQEQERSMAQEREGGGSQDGGGDSDQ